MCNSLKFPSRFQTEQNQQRLKHPLLVITYPSLRYMPGVKSTPFCPVAGPLIFTGAICRHFFSSFSASGKSHEKVTEICTSSASANISGLPTYARLSVGVAFVRRGNTLIILISVSLAFILFICFNQALFLTNSAAL